MSFVQQLPKSVTCHLPYISSGWQLTNIKLSEAGSKSQRKVTKSGESRWIIELVMSGAGCSDKQITRWHIKSAMSMVGLLPGRTISTVMHHMLVMDADIASLVQTAGSMHPAHELPNAERFSLPFPALSVDCAVSGWLPLFAEASQPAPYRLRESRAKVQLLWRIGQERKRNININLFGR